MTHSSTPKLGRNLGMVFVLVAGVLMTAAGVLHSLAGWPALSTALETAGIGGSLKTTVGVGWILGGMSMLAMGLMTLLLYSQLRNGRVGGQAQGVVTGLLFLLFGGGASVLDFPNTNFLFFMAAGALLLVGLWTSRPR